MSPKLNKFAMLREMLFSFKKDAITVSPSLDPDSCYPFNKKNYFFSL